MKKISEKTLFDGQWLSVHELVYHNKDGRPLVWESVRRKKLRVGVIVVARFKHSGQYILIKQYRPAINGYILSFPAGLGDGDPAHALVELKEETGYQGKITAVSPVLKTGASLIDDNAYIVTVEVDEHLPENRHPKQELEDSEDIQVCLVGKDEGRDYLLKEAARGIHIASNLWYVFGFLGE